MGGHECSEAARLLAEADKASQGSKWLFFTQAPDYGEASELYVQAANALKASKCWSEAGDAFKRAAAMDEKGGEGGECARKLLSAASCYRKCNVALAIATTKEAVNLLVASGRFHLAASNEKEIAEMYESGLEDYAGAITFYKRAAERYEGEDSGAMAASCMLKSAHLSANIRQYEEAAQVFEEAASSSVGDSLRKYSVRENLFKAGLCRLCCEDRIAARRRIESYGAIDGSFQGSRELELLVALCKAREEEDVDAFTDLLSAFDRTHTLDDWKMRLLLTVKEGITSAGEDLT